MTRVACLFPTFPMRQREFCLESLHGYRDVMTRLAERAARLVTITERTFDFPDAERPLDALDDTLQSHYACYIEGVAMGELLQRHYPACNYVTGYSMGLFAGLCHSGAVSFEDGLALMHGICVNAHGLVDAGRYAMGVIVGLTSDSVQQVLTAECPQVEITDVYGERMIIISGTRTDAAGALDACVTHGALETKMIPVTVPFHSSALAAMETLTSAMVRELPVHSPRCGIVSAITQQVLTRPEDIRVEIAGNISHPMSWYATMRTLIDLNVSLLLECGASTKLTNLAKRDVPGTYTILDFRDFERLFATAS